MRDATVHSPLTLLLTVGAGVLLAVQARVNGALGEGLGVVAASLVSILTGLVLLGAIAAVRRGARRQPVRLRLWWLAGGLIGAGVVTLSAASAPRVGVSLVSLAVVGGATAGSLAADAAGIAPGGRRALTWRRAVGAGLGVAAVAIGAGGLSGLDAADVALLAALVGFGAGSAAQQAANAHLRNALGDSVRAALVNFSVGAGALSLLVATDAVTLQRDAWTWSGRPQDYLGGVCGATYIVIAASVTERVGVLSVTLGTVAGQLAGAVALDAFAPASGTTLTAGAIAGVALAIVAVLVAARG